MAVTKSATALFVAMSMIAIVAPLGHAHRVNLDAAESPTQTPQPQAGDKLAPPDVGFGEQKNMDVITDPASILRCTLSLESVNKCGKEFFSSIFRFRIKILGPECCNAINSIDEACWPKQFPYNPFDPPLLKRYCAQQEAAAKATPGPTTAANTWSDSQAVIQEEAPKAESPESGNNRYYYE